MNEEILDQLVLQLLSTIALDGTSAPATSAFDWPIAAWIAVHGTLPLCIEVGLTPAAALQLAGLITGLTAEDLLGDATLQQDLANEIANVLAGNIRPVIEGATSIGLPQVGRAPRSSGGSARVYSVRGVPILAVVLCEQRV